MSYWMVIPNPSQPSLAVDFEVFGDVRTVRNQYEAEAVAEKYGEPLAVVLGVPVDGLPKRVAWFRYQYPRSRLYLAGAISPFQLAGLDVTKVLPTPLPLEVVKTIRAELELEDQLGHQLPSVPASTQTMVSASEQEEMPKEPKGRDQIIVVFSGKGGDGKTTVAAQLGILLAKRNIATLIIDADYKGNEAEWFRGMHQPPIHSLLDFRSEESKDRALLESYLMEKNGLKILPCPQVEVGPIPPAVLERAIQAYKPFYQVIILDMHQGFSPELLLAAQYANKFIAVAVPSDHRLYPFSVTLNQLLSHRVSKKNLHIVVNRANRGEADIRKIRTGIQDILGESFNHYHSLPFVEELSYDDDPEFVAISDMRNSEPYPSAFLKLAEAVTGMSLRKSEGRNEKPAEKKSNGKRKNNPRSANTPGKWLAMFFGPPVAKKKSVKQKGGRKR